MIPFIIETRRLKCGCETCWNCNKICAPGNIFPHFSLKASCYVQQILHALKVFYIANTHVRSALLAISYKILKSQNRFQGKVIGYLALQELEKKRNILPFESQTIDIYEDLILTPQADSFT